jgi:CDP-diacylglycerol--glycerol-3-phosphate 3-phosphatidyltransferase
VSPPTATSDAPGGQSRLTFLNGLCALRLLLSPLLVVLAWSNWPAWCLALAVLLFLTDWLDGKLAKLLHQETEFGARLDSLADVAFYVCVLLALLELHGNLLRRELPWIVPALGSYAVSVAAALVKFRRPPSYHTRLAKTSWLLMLIAVVAVFFDLSVWTVRVAMLGVFLTNLEATLITFLLPQWRANVPSVFHARRTAAEKDDTSC